MQWNCWGCWTETVKVKGNKIEYWAYKCKWELPVKWTGSHLGESVVFPFSAQLLANFIRSYQFDKCNFGPQSQARIRRRKLFGACKLEYDMQRCTFAVWAIAASKPPAAPYLPQPVLTATSNECTDICC